MTPARGGQVIHRNREETRMKVMAICAGRKNGNGEILAKEALLGA